MKKAIAIAALLVCSAASAADVSPADLIMGDAAYSAKPADLDSLAAKIDALTEKVAAIDDDLRGLAAHPVFTAADLIAGDASVKKVVSTPVAQPIMQPSITCANGTCTVNYGAPVVTASGNCANGTCSPPQSRSGWFSGKPTYRRVYGN